MGAQLRSGVKTVVGNRRAFAALKADGSVVCWGNEDRGGESSSVAVRREELRTTKYFAKNLSNFSNIFTIFYTQYRIFLQTSRAFHRRFQETILLFFREIQ